MEIVFHIVWEFSVLDDFREFDSHIDLSIHILWDVDQLMNRISHIFWNVGVVGRWGGGDGDVPTTLPAGQTSRL